MLSHLRQRLSNFPVNRLGLLIGYLALALLCSGCPAEDEEDGNGDGGAPDLYRDIPRDTSDIDDTAADAAEIQADAQPGTVTIHAYDDNGELLILGQAIFHDPDGSYRSQELIGRDGLVSAELPPGAMVTIVQEEELVRVTMRTIVGLQPGDDLTVGWQEPEIPFEQVGRLAVTVSSAVTDADYYLMSLGYSGFGAPGIETPIQGSVYRRDLTEDGQVNLVAIALQRDQRLAYAVQTDITLLEDTTTGVTLPAWRTDWGTFVVNGTNAPADARLLAVEFEDLLDTLRYESADDAVPLAAGGSAAVTLENLVTQVGDRFGYRVGVLFGLTDFEDGYSAVIRADQARTATVTLDLSSTLLPRVHDVSLDTADGARPSITFNRAGNLAVADGAVLAVAWRDTDYVQHRWSFLAPGQTSSPFRLPELPDDRASWRPGSEVTYLDLPWVAFFEADFIDGYDAARAEGSSIVETAPVDIPPGGWLRVSSAGGDVF